MIINLNNKFKELARIVSTHYQYTPEDKRDLVEMYNKNRNGVVNALEMQVNNINVMNKLRTFNNEKHT